MASAAFASMASIRLADSMLPRLAADFGRAPAEAAWVITGFTLAYGLMQLVYGPIGDRLGKLRVIAAASLLAALGSMLCAAAPTLASLAVARVATGACCAAIIPLSIAHIGDTVGERGRQVTLARFATGTLLGLTAGQVLGGVAADTVGWRGAFVLLSLVFAAVGATMVGHLRGAAPQPAGATNAALLRAYADVARPRWSRFVLAAGLVEGAVMFGALAFIPTWLHVRFGAGLSMAGLVVAAVGIGGLLYASSAGHWLRHFRVGSLARLGGVLVTLGWTVLLAASWLPAATTVLWGAGSLLAGLGFYMLHNTLQMLATQLAPQARATAVGLFAVALFLGQSMGVASAGWLAPRIGYEALIGGAGMLFGLLGAVVAAGLDRRARHAPAGQQG